MSDRDPWVGILMGSSSDAKTMEPCWQVLKEYGIPCEVRVLSAHRTPDEAAVFVREAEGRGIGVLVAAAGMAAHLAGACAAHGILPVIGVPIASGPLQGQDALLSTVMMPPGLPVATVGINGAANAGHLAAQILALRHPELKERLRGARAAMREKVLAQDRELAGGS